MHRVFGKSVSKLIVLAIFTFLAACSSSNRASVDSAKPSATAQKLIKSSSLKQRPSEINRPVSGKITRTGEIYLLRGLANVFSRGMDTLGAKMVRRGIDARVYNHGAWRELAANIVARHKKKQVSYPIVIMGHSLGANASSGMANYLGSRGIKVQYVVAFDPTVKTSVGKNVNRVVNFYLPNDKHSNVIRKAPGFKGTLKNINVTGVRGLKHTTVEKDAKFHNQVIQRTLGYTKKRRKRRS